MAYSGEAEEIEGLHVGSVGDGSLQDVLTTQRPQITHRRPGVAHTSAGPPGALCFAHGELRKLVVSQMRTSYGCEMVEHEYDVGDIEGFSYWHEQTKFRSFVVRGLLGKEVGVTCAFVQQKVSTEEEMSYDDFDVCKWDKTECSRAIMNLWDGTRHVLIFEMDGANHNKEGPYDWLFQDSSAPPLPCVSDEDAEDLARSVMGLRQASPEQFLAFLLSFATKSGAVEPRAGQLFGSGECAFMSELIATGAVDPSKGYGLLLRPDSTFCRAMGLLGHTFGAESGVGKENEEPSWLPLHSDAKRPAAQEDGTAPHKLTKHADAPNTHSAATARPERRDIEKEEVDLEELAAIDDAIEQASLQAASAPSSQANAAASHAGPGGAIEMEEVDDEEFAMIELALSQASAMPSQ